MGFLKNLAGKTMDLMTEDTVYSMSKNDDDSAEELLLKASDQNYLDYVSAYVRLVEKKKYPGSAFYYVIMRTISDRPADVQRRAREILNSMQKG